MKVKPLYNRILIEPIIENTTESGLIICHPNLIADQMRKGKVIHVGLKCTGTKAGDVVIYEKHRGVTVEVNKQKLLQVREDDIDAVLETYE